MGDLDHCLSDNSQAWNLNPDGHYELLQPTAGTAAVSVQAILLGQLAESVPGPVS
jgi:hypothetical protein